MRTIFSIVSLLAVTLVIGLLAKKQLTRAAAPLAVPSHSASSPAAERGVTPAQQMKQFQQSLETTLQQARPEPAE